MIDPKLRKRTEEFSTRVMELVDVLPHGMEGQAISIELRHAGSTLEASYRAALTSRSPEELNRRIGSVRHGAAECMRWMQLISAARLVQSPRLDELLLEGRGILAMIEAHRKGSAEKKKDPPPPRSRAAA
jgi:four helix bundle protein